MAIGTGFKFDNWENVDHTPMQVGAGSQIGEIVWDRDRAYRRVRLDAASAAVARGDLVGIDNTGAACLALTTTTAATVGRLAKVGVARGAGTAGQVGWVQVYGVSPLNFAAAAAARAALYTTATAGKVDDAVTVGVLGGIVAPVAPGAVTLETAELNWPYLVSVV